jgi:hypothetical protein
MVHKFHMPTQRNILVWILTPSYGGKSILRGKSEEPNKFRKMYWLLGRNSELPIHNKIILYKQVIRPGWSYGIQLWGCASDPNIEVIQRYKNKVLKCIVNTPSYVRNSDLHRDIGIETVTDIIAKFANSQEKRLQNHINIEGSRLLNVNNITRRLKREKSFELVTRQNTKWFNGNILVLII